MSVAPSNFASSSSNARRRRNPRPINSCLECRLRKAKCSRTYPCQNCTLSQRECVFISGPQAKSTTGAPSQPRESISAEAASVPSEQFREETPPRDYEWESYQQEISPEAGTWDTLVPDPAILHDATYIDDDNNDAVESDMSSTTLQIGRLCITERIGGLFRPHFARELERVLSRDGRIEISPPKAAQSSFSAYQRKSNTNAFGLLSTSRMPEISAVILPQRSEAYMFYQQYLQSVNPIIHILHIPSFKRMFDSFWDNVEAGFSNSGPQTALVLAMCLSAAASMSSLQTRTQFGVDQEALYAQLKAVTENAFKTWNCFTSSSILSLQALSIYLMTECRNDIPRSHSILVGALIRLAQCVGIHRHNILRSLSQLQQHVRSLLWYHICYLDLKTAEAQGPQPTIRPDDFDVPMPCNVDDLAFEAPNFDRNSATGWTDVTFSFLRFEFTTLHRRIFNGRLQVDRGNMTLQELRLAVAKTRTSIEKRYLSAIDSRVPIQRLAQLFSRLMLARGDSMIFNNYLPRGERTKTEHHLRDLLLEASLTICEAGATIETSLHLQPFAWYAGAYQQYHSVLTLVSERYRDPALPCSSRIEKILDHVFGPCYGVELTQRCADILWRVKEGVESLYEVRKVTKPDRTGIAGHSGQSIADEVQALPNMKLSEAELEDLFKSFPDGSTGFQDAFLLGPGAETGSSQFDAFSSFPSGYEHGGNLFGTGMPDLGYQE